MIDKRYTTMKDGHALRDDDGRTQVVTEGGKVVADLRHDRDARYLCDRLRAAYRRGAEGGKR